MDEAAGQARAPIDSPPPASPPAPADAPPPFAERRGNPDGHRVRPPSPRVALLLVAAVVTAILLYQGREALSPFIVGLLIVYLLNPAVEWLTRRRVPRWVSVLLVYVVVVVVVVQSVAVITRPLVEQVRTFVADLPGLLAQARAFYDRLDLPPAIRQSVDEWLAGLGAGGGIDPSIFLPVVNLTAGFISGMFGYLIIPVWAFYILKDRPQLMAAFNRTLPAEWRRDVWAVIGEVQRVFGQWVRAQLFLGVTVGIATFVGLQILNFTVDPIFGRFALLLAVSAGILELLPIIGPIIAAIPAILLAATAGPEAALAAFMLYLLVQQIENNVLVPKIQGDAVELHPSAVMFSLVIGGAIAGLLGAILALPVTAAGRNVFRYLFRRLSSGEGSADGPERAISSSAAASATPAAAAQTAPTDA